MHYSSLIGGPEDDKGGLNSLSKMTYGQEREREYNSKTFLDKSHGLLDFSATLCLFLLKLKTVPSFQV